MRLFNAHQEHVFLSFLFSSLDIFLACSISHAWHHIGINVHASSHKQVGVPILLFGTVETQRRPSGLPQTKIEPEPKQGVWSVGTLTCQQEQGVEAVMKPLMVCCTTPEGRK